MNDFAAHKMEVEKKIVEEIIKQFEKQAVTEERMSELAHFILGRYDTISNHQELVTFINDLAKKEPFFQNLATVENGEQNLGMEQQAARQALQLLQSGQAAAAAFVAGEANK